MKYPYYIADVFTRQIFGGAQIAVFPTAGPMGTAQMQRVARELNLSETVFIQNGDDPNKRFTMRIFSPQQEIGFAGHPVIATAYVLASTGILNLRDGVTPAIFEQNAGPIEVNITGKDGQPTFVQFTRKVSAFLDYFTPTIGELADLLGLKASEIDVRKYWPRLVSCNFPYLVVPVWQYGSVRKAKFNYNAWGQSSAPQTAAQEILLFSPKTAHQDSDFHARLLGPRIGVNEDPPVGSAMPAFACYLGSFDWLKKGTYTFAVDRGEDRTRRSLLNLEMDHKREDAMTIRVGGEAVMVAEGVMTVPDL